MQQSWQVFIMLHALFSALQALQFRAIARDKYTRHASLAVNAIAFSALYIFSLFILPLLGDVNFSEFTNDWQIYIATAALIVLALFLMYKAFTHLESATASVLGTSSALFTVIIAGFFYGERLTAPQIVGIAIVLPCIWYVLLLAKRSKKLIDFRNHNWLYGFWFMLASSLCLAVAHILEKDILERSSVGSYVAFGWFFQMAFAWVLYLAAGRHAKKIFKNYATVRSSIQLGALRAGTGIFFVLALKASNNVSLMTVIANFRIIIVAVLAGWLLGEKRYYYKKNSRRRDISDWSEYNFLERIVYH